MVAAVVLTSALLLVLTGYLAWRFRPAVSDDASRFYRKFCARLARARIVRRPGEGPAHFARRAGREFPAQSEVISRITTLYLKARYEGGATPEELAGLQQMVRGFRPVQG